MHRSRAKSQDQTGDPVVQWLRNRANECVLCSACQKKTIPFAAYCHNCGQANPAKVSASAVVYLTIAIVFLAVTLPVLVNVVYEIVRFAIPHI